MAILFEETSHLYPKVSPNSHKSKLPDNLPVFALDIQAKQRWPFEDND